MKTTIHLNLNNSKNTEIRQYPDGQQDVILSNIDHDCNYEIISRFNSFRDLEIILCATAALRNAEIENISLKIPYLLGARSDRQFVHGSCSYLRDIIARVINSMNYKRVTTLDVHSDVASGVINRLYSEVPFNFWSFFRRHSNLKNMTVLVPDAGALKRVYSFADDATNCVDEIICCSKHRDIKTGKILETIVPKNDFEKRDIVIVDDLCDGGRTFIEMAKVIRTKNAGRIFLVVTHGIFSKGIDLLREYFNCIYCTNSYKDISDPLVFQYNVY